MVKPAVKKGRRGAGAKPAGPPPAPPVILPGDPAWRFRDLKLALKPEEVEHDLGAMMQQAEHYQRVRELAAQRAEAAAVQQAETAAPATAHAPARKTAIAAAPAAALAAPCQTVYVGMSAVTAGAAAQAPPAVQAPAVLAPARGGPPVCNMLQQTFPGMQPKPQPVQQYAIAS